MHTALTPEKPRLVSLTRLDWDVATLKQSLRLMMLSRRLDEKMLALLKQGKSFFHIGCAGHEAAQVAAAKALKMGTDWSYPYYRDQAFCLGMGMTPTEILLSFLARAEDPNSGGRQMPQHYGHKGLRIVSQSSPTGTQFLQAAGMALAARKRGESAVVYVSAGEGTTSQGDFHEACNWAAKDRLPVVFHIEDNKFAISVPVTEQTAGGTISGLVGAYAGMAVARVDGCDVEASHAAFQEAVGRARAGDGPTVVVSDVVRLYPHSSSDDQRKYRPEAELTADRARDPITTLVQRLTALGVASSEVEEMRAQIHQEVDAAADAAEAYVQPAPSTATRHVWCEEISTTHPDHPVTPTPPLSAQPTVLVDAINKALQEEMARNRELYVFGEDVAGGKGGVFTATRGLTAAFGVERCFNSPLAESSIVGVAIGMATAGLRACPEIQFGDYIWTAMMQIRNELATLRYRSNNAFSCPVVVRVPVGGYIHGALCHSQNIEGFFAHLPGIRIALPSNALDAYGMLKAALRGKDPVLFLEHKGLYRQAYAASGLPSEDWVLPLGHAAIKRPGTDLTVVTYGAMVQRCLQAADELGREDLELEVIDLRTIQPLDTATITGSLKKTGRLLIVHEDNRFAGFGAEIAAHVAEHCFELLDAPVVRVAGKDSPVPYNASLEEQVLPQLGWITGAARKLIEF